MNDEKLQNSHQIDYSALLKEIQFLTNRTKFLSVLTNIPGYFCVFVFDEPDLLLSDTSAVVKQRVLSTSSLIPICDKTLRNRLYTLSQKSSYFSKDDFDLFHSPRGFFSINPGENAHHFKERILKHCRRSSVFRRFWRRHTDCPISLDVSGSGNLIPFTDKISKKIISSFNLTGRENGIKEDSSKRFFHIPTAAEPKLFDLWGPPNEIDDLSAYPELRVQTDFELEDNFEEDENEDVKNENESDYSESDSFSESSTDTDESDNGEMNPKNNNARVIHLPQDRDQWPLLLNTPLSIRVL
jgi:hypothetical protein